MQDFLEARRAKFGTLQKLATAMRVTFSGFLRGVKQGTLSAENCLRLAEVLGEEPSVIFRVANKVALADQFDRLYGKTTNPMTDDERVLVDTWRALTSTGREGLRLMLSELARTGSIDRDERREVRRRRSHTEALKKRGRST